MEVVGTLPPTPRGHTDVMAHYDSYHHAAKAIAERIITDNDKERATRELQQFRGVFHVLLLLKKARPNTMYNLRVRSPRRRSK
jgi:hypothetical protein